LKEGLERLEPYDGKPSRTVLRGGCGGNITSLPDYLEFLVDYNIASDIFRVLDVVRSDGMRREGGEFPRLYTQAMDRFKEVERHRREKTLPPRQFDPGDWHCNYCGFGEMCNSSYEEEFASFSEGAEFQIVEELVGEYIQLTALKKETEESLEGVKDEIKKSMKASGLRQAKSNGCFISLSLQKRQSLDKSLIPYEILKDVQKETLVEVLNVRSGGVNGFDKKGRSYEKREKNYSE